MCAHFGWPLDYLLHGIPWPTVQKMLADAPGIEDNDSKSTTIELTDDNADEVFNLLTR